MEYVSNYGVGVKLEILDFDLLDLEGIESMYDYLDNLPEEEGLWWFELSTEGDNEFYLCFTDTLHDDFDNKRERFKDYLKDNNVKYIDEIDLVGGLHVS